MFLSGLSIPSKILLIIPGPSVTKIALSVPITSSPGFNPLVSSYTCIVVLKLLREITSPTNFSFPTYTISPIKNSVLPFIYITGPLIPNIFAIFMFAPFPLESYKIVSPIMLYFTFKRIVDKYIF